MTREEVEALLTIANLKGQQGVAIHTVVPRHNGHHWVIVSKDEYEMLLNERGMFQYGLDGIDKIRTDVFVEKIKDEQI